ncbi:hypothetical protein Tco_1118012 [Tanacetum coccineum]
MRKRNLQGTASVQGTASFHGTATSQGTAEIQKTADFQGTAEPHDAASIPKSPNDYTPTDVFQTSGGDEGLLDIYALNREVRRLKKQTLSQAKQILKLKAKLKQLSKFVQPVEVDIIKKTENQAKMTKLSMEWKRLCKIKAKSWSLVSLMGAAFSFCSFLNMITWGCYGSSVGEAVFGDYIALLLLWDGSGELIRCKARWTGIGVGSARVLTGSAREGSVEWGWGGRFAGIVDGCLGWVIVGL